MNFGVAVWLAAFAWGSATLAGTPPAPPRDTATMNAAAEFLLLRYEAGRLAPFAGEGDMRAVVRFREIPSPSALHMLEAEGVVFPLLAHGARGRQLAMSRRMFAARIPWAKVRTLLRHPLVERIEAVLLPPLPSLDASNEEVDAADGAWLHFDDAAEPLRGKGVILAALDFNVDVHHGMFFRPSDDLYDWIDANANSVFDAGTDCVDINANGVCDSGETLRFVDGRIHLPVTGGPSNTIGVFEADRDWLYRDANDDGARNLAGDATPTYGELFFFVEDADGDNALTLGEKLRAAGESKILATYNAGDVIRRRGTDLTLTDTPVRAHGSAVLALATGGGPGRLFRGIAPDVDILFGDLDTTDEYTLAEWAEAEGAHVVNHSYGRWWLEFMDGTSAYEQLLDTQSAAGMVHVVAAGNLANAEKHAYFTVPASGSVANTANAVASTTWIFNTYLWRTPANALRFRVTPPSTPASGDLPMNPSWTETVVGSYRVWTRKETSTAGTVKVDFAVEHVTPGTPIPGTWTFTAFNDSGAGEAVDGYLIDSLFSAGAGTRYTSHIQNFRTVLLPGTADSALVVASYDHRGLVNPPPGEVSAFSGRGPRVDGAPIVSVAAPAHFDVHTARTKEAAGWGWYTRFTGTSAAAPHAAGAAAIVKQYIPALTSAQIRDAIRAGALEDADTGTTPNDEWGHGKLRVLQALKEADRTPPAWDSTVGAQSASAGACGNITITWNAATDLYKNPVTYHIYRETMSGFTPSKANRVGSTASLSFAEQVPTAGTYYYVVRAEDSAIEPNEDTNTVEVSAVVAEDDALPYPVGNTLEADASPMFFWAASANADEYIVMRGDAPDALALHDTVSAPTTSYDDAALPLAGETFFYRILASNACGEEAGGS